MVPYVQMVTPNVNVPGYSGGCLQYVDDGVNPPSRQPTAQASWNYAVSTGVAHPNEEPPNNVWVPVYYSIDNGRWAGYGHVAWFFSDGKTTKIYDSEYGAGVRSVPYSSGAELFQHMGWKMRYYGWSEAVDGLRVVKAQPNEQPKPNKPQPTVKEIKDMEFLLCAGKNVKEADAFIGDWYFIKDWKATHIKTPRMLETAKEEAKKKGINQYRCLKSEFDREFK